MKSLLRFAPLLLASHAAAQQNMLVLVADDLGVDMVAVYGEGPDPAPTPTIDRLVESGVLFRNAWANPVCSPTRAMIQTGLHAFRTGVGDVIEPGDSALPTEELTLPELLDLAGTGYGHAAFGKWHLGAPQVGGVLSPNVAGYSHFAGTMENFVYPNSYFSWPKVVNGETSVSTTYATTDTVDEALAWIETAPEPWLCYVAFNAPHSPFHAPPADLHTIELPDVSPRRWPRPFYKAAVQAMDSEINRLLVGLGDKTENTNIVFVGDNGTPKEASKTPFVPDHAKRSPYEGGVNVPLIVSGPAVSEPMREVDALVSATDLFATIAELAGVDGALAATPDSVSIVPYLQSPTAPPLRETAYAEFFTPNGSDEVADVRWRMIREARYKLIVRGSLDDEHELYDLLLDPFEEHQLLEVGLSESEQAAYQALLAELTLLESGG